MSKNLIRFSVGVVVGLLVLCGIDHVTAQEANSFLVMVSRTDPAAVPLLQERDIPVQYKLADWFIAEAGPEDLRVLQASGIEHRIIDREAWSRPYYHILRPDGRLARGIPEVAQVIYQADREAIVKIEERDIFALGRAGFQFTRIVRRPLPLEERPAPKALLLKERTSTDEVIGALVNQVSQVTTRAYVQRLQDFRTRFVDCDSIYASAQWLRRTFEDFGYDDVILEEYYVSNPGRYNVVDVLAQNVIATKTGILYPDSVYIIGGHYDSIVFDGGDPRIWAPGADDNASAVAAVLEAARILADIDLDCTVKFACWSAEEIGLLGAEHYAEQALRRGENIALYINFDMIANVDPADPELDINIGRNARAGAYSDLMVQIAHQYTSLVTHPYMTSGGGSDHSPFIQHGYDILYGHEGDFSPHWHEGTDVVDNMDFRYMSDVVKMGLGTLAALAGPPESFPGAVIAYETSTIDDDGEGESTGNGNGSVDPGETIEIVLSLHNYGDSVAEGAYARLVIDDPSVTLVENTRSFGDIPPGETRDSDAPFTFTVSDQAPNGRHLNFAVEVEAAGEQSWNTYFSVVVEQPDIAYETFHYTEVDGDGDGILNPGETVEMYLIVKNIGLRKTSGITARLETDDADVVISDDEAVFPDMMVSATVENAGDPFLVTLAEDAEPHVILFHLILTEESGYFETDLTFRLLVGQGRVLLVVDDGGIGYTQYYTRTLQYMGVMFDTWVTETRGKLPPDDLFQYGEVIWFTGSIGTRTLTADDQIMIADYLDGGGRLFLSGNLIGFEIGRTPFFRDYLHGEFVQFFTRLHHLQSSPANPVSRGMELTLAAQGETGQSFTAETDPIAPAFSIFNYDRTTTEGPGDIRSSGSGALAFENGTYKLVYFSFGFEGIEPFEARATLLGQILTWFQMPAQQRGDVNGDGSLNALDVVLAINSALGTYEPTEAEFERSDVNFDGVIDVLDIMGIVDRLLSSPGQ